MECESLCPQLTSSTKPVSPPSQFAQDLAEKLLREALVIRQAVFGEAHPATAEVLNGIAATLSAQGEFAELVRVEDHIARRAGAGRQLDRDRRMAPRKQRNLLEHGR